MLGQTAPVQVRVERAPFASEHGGHTGAGPRPSDDPAVIVSGFASRAGHLLGRVVPGGQVGLGQSHFAIVDALGRVDRAVVPEMDVGVGARIAQAASKDVFVQFSVVGPGHHFAVEVQRIQICSPIAVAKNHVLRDGEAVVAPIVGVDENSSGCVSR